MGKADQKTIIAAITELSERYGDILEEGEVEVLDEATLEVLSATRGLQVSRSMLNFRWLEFYTIHVTSMFGGSLESCARKL